jgi:hypothetical protein
MCGGPHLGFRSPQATAFFFARALAIPLSFVFSFDQAQSTTELKATLTPTGLTCLPPPPSYPSPLDVRCAYAASSLKAIFLELYMLSSTKIQQLDRVLFTLLSWEWEWDW